MISNTVRILVYLAVIVTFHRNVLSNAALFISKTNVTPETGVNEQQNCSRKETFNNLGYFPSSTEDLNGNRIFGGKNATKGQFPFMAMVYHLLGEGKVSQCGGTIVSSRWVLTAGHCIAKMPRNFRVVFGIVDKSDVGISMVTHQGALHPQYRETENDIGLLYMPRDIPLTKNIQAIQLPKSDYRKQSFDDKKALVIGWGQDGVSSIGSRYLKYATLPIISNFRCGSHWNVNIKHICTAAGIGEDACRGDSGGPLVVTENGRTFQVGIVSYGDKYCPSSKPGVFTRVTPFLQWIQEVTLIKF